MIYKIIYDVSDFIYFQQHGTTPMQQFTPSTYRTEVDLTDDISVSRCSFTTIFPNCLLSVLDTLIE